LLLNILLKENKRLEGNLKTNCWEFKNCGRQPGGKQEKELGVCPAPLETKLDGVHKGKNAGRACWVVSGTLCGGVVQGTFAKKFQNCETCEFYQAVRKEEQPNFQLSPILLSKLRA
jgi:hypothetical protein